MMHFIVLFALIGVTGAKWANIENQKCVEECMAGTPLAAKLKDNAKKCAEDIDEDNDRKRRSIDLDEEEVEEEVVCSTFEEITSYLAKQHCELEENGWMTEEGQESEKVHWNVDAVKADIFSSPEDNDKLKTYWNEKTSAHIKRWLVLCGKEKKETLLKRLLQSKYCAEKYTDEQKNKLNEVLATYGGVITQNMCLRRLFGVACGCNDIMGKLRPKNKQ